MDMLITVAIIAIVTALAVPHFVAASDEAVRGTLQGQAQRVTSQLSLYRSHNKGALPALGANAGAGGGPSNDGWGRLVGERYLKRPPLNVYTETSDLIETPGAAPNLPPGSPMPGVTPGWGYRPEDLVSDPANPLHAVIFARGFDRKNDRLSHESGYTQVVP